MRRRILMLLTIFAGALLQQLLPPWPLFGGMKPPILAALALHYALRRDNRDMWLVVFTAAIFQDGLTMATFGPALLAFPVMGFSRTGFGPRCFRMASSRKCSLAPRLASSAALSRYWFTPRPDSAPSISDSLWFA